MNDTRGPQRDTGVSKPRDGQVSDHLRLESKTVYEIVRQEGEIELARPVPSLWWSGVAAGIGICVSVLAEAFLHHRLPDTSWRPVLENFGYCAGFLLVICCRLQLFTEHTITAVLPLLSDTSVEKCLATARLWLVVFAANLVGTFLTAFFIVHVGTVPEVYLPAILEVSHHFAQKTPIECFLHAIPAGFLIAAIVWALPSAEGSEFWVITTFTYLIALGDFAHVVAGSAEVFVLVLSGELGVVKGIGGLIGPAFLGNVVGGTVLFALLAYAQVQEEIDGP